MSWHGTKKLIYPQMCEWGDSCIEKSWFYPFYEKLPFKVSQRGRSEMQVSISCPRYVNFNVPFDLNFEFARHHAKFCMQQLQGTNSSIEHPIKIAVQSNACLPKPSSVIFVISFAKLKGKSIHLHHFKILF